MSDYSVPVTVRVNASGDINVDEVEVDPTTGDIYYSDTTWDESDSSLRPRFIRIPEGKDESETFVFTGFKQPGHRGLAIDTSGNLYTDNAASDAQFGGRLFKFSQPNGEKEFTGTVNYFSRQLMFAHPTSTGPMAMGPGGSPNVSDEDLYVVDELAGQVKRAPVKAGFDPYRRVAQPWADLPFSGRSLDLEIDEDGNGYLLNERIGTSALTVDLKISDRSLTTGETFTVTLTVVNPGGDTISSVAPFPFIERGDGKVNIVKLPTQTTVDLGPGQVAEFTYEYMAMVSGTVSFLAQAQGSDSEGVSVSSPLVESEDWLVQITDPKPLEVFIEFPNKYDTPVIRRGDPFKVNVTVQANKGDLSQVAFQGSPLMFSPAGNLTILQVLTPPIESDFELLSGQSKTFEFELKTVKRGLIDLSTFVKALDADGKPLSAKDLRQVRVTAPILSVEVKADPSELELKDGGDKPVPEEISLTVTVTNIHEAPVTETRLPAKLQLRVVLDDYSIEGAFCSLTQTEPDPNGNDIVLGSLSPGESKAQTFKLIAEDDGKCDVVAQVTAADPDFPSPSTTIANGVTRIRIGKKGLLELEIDFRSDVMFHTETNRPYWLDKKKINPGESFMAYGMIWNRSNTQKIKIDRINYGLDPDKESAIARVHKPCLKLLDDRLFEG
ncbi:MAG: hypothetical protein HY731_04975 [Candidatus Tectomicrobia bacterium]|nr:hypothetical protein [Candidatus Tectomicrobia bacterium]